MQKAQPPARVRRHQTPLLFKTAKQLEQHPELRAQVKAALEKYLPK